MRSPLASSSLAALGFAVCLLLGLAGCGNSDPLQQTVNAPDPDAYHDWSSNTVDSLSQQDQTLYHQSENDIRLNAMAAGADSPDQALCDAINGKTIRQVIVLGLHDRIRRLQGDLKESRKLLSENAKLEPTNQTGVDTLDATIDEDRSRVSEDQSEIKQAETHLAQMSAAGKPSSGT